ncbi:FMN-binding negative transcriptional regulator [Dechloromonas sp. ZY10]|uniref:FMN-binding negative transcriptional regulator n=1 Tax=Dechloromonas aquae TaxID=2664436 RepID=UPI00352753DC
MYLPASFQQTDPQRIAALLHEHPLGLLVSHGSRGLQCSPLPFQFVPQSGEQGMLKAHLARANPHWKELDGSDCLVVFQGAQGYVAPEWYPSKAASGRAVPTWNYAAVEVRGRARVVQDLGWLQAQLGELTAEHEGRRACPWSPADAPPDYLAAQLRAIVGLEITITGIDGKWKMSQNRDSADRAGVIAGLRDPADPHAHPVLADLVADSCREA